MDEKGVYAIARSLWDCDAFMNQKYTQREAWMWLIGAAVWKQTRINLDGRRIILERGEFAFSLRFLAKKWKWAKSTVSRFIFWLKNEDMIRDTSRDGSFVFLISKYNDFQVVGLPNRDSERDTKRDTDGTAVGHSRDKEEALQTLQSSSLRSDEQPAKRSSSETLPDWLDREAWAAFLDMRKKKRAPVTPRAVQILIGKLEKWRMGGHDPTAILDASTASAWVSLYEPKLEKQHGQRKSTNHDNWTEGLYLAAGDGKAT